MPPVSCSLFPRLALLSLSLCLAPSVSVSLVLRVCVCVCVCLSNWLSVIFWSGNVDLTPTILGRRLCGRAMIGVMDVRFEAAEPGSEARRSVCSFGDGRWASGAGRKSQEWRGLGAVRRPSSCVNWLGQLPGARSRNGWGVGRLGARPVSEWEFGLGLDLEARAKLDELYKDEYLQTMVASM